MKPLSDITLRLYGEDALLEEDPRRLLELFLDSLGITSDVARDVFHVLLVARADDTAISAKQVRDGVEGLRRLRGDGKPERGLTMRNVHVWLRHFRDVRLVDKIGGLYRFKGNKTPSRSFAEGTRPLISASADFTERLLQRLEGAYRIGK